MGWLGKLFGGGATLVGLRKALEQRNFAEARLLAEQLLEQDLSAEEAAEVEQLRTVAGDGLAQLNLDEALGFRNCGDAERAAEHLQLALEQVCSAELRQRVEQLMADEPLVPELSAPAASPSACGSCGPQPATPLAAAALDLPDAESQLELVLTSYPPELAERYRQKDQLFVQAFLLSHGEEDAAALPLWNRVADAEQDDLYWFEFGAALARSGKLAEARTALQNALQANPGLVLANEALVTVLLGSNDPAAAQQLLQQMLEKGQDPAFCHAQLAMICLHQQQSEAAIAHVHQALAAGIGDPGFLLTAASVLEQAGVPEEAEGVLRRLPGGGCGGGLSLPLAEFLLRQKRELGKILDTFNGACRQEPDNPRWPLRVAQTYLARGWQKDGLALLQKVDGDPRLTAELQQEVVEALRQYGS